MYTYVYIYVHIYTHTYMYTYIYIWNLEKKFLIFKLSMMKPILPKIIFET